MILAYSVAVAGKIEAPKDLQSIHRGPLQCFYCERQETPLTSESEVRDFFTTNQTLFAQADILEFRFPTVVHEVAELEQFLARHEQTILADLQRLHGLAQLTVYLPKRSATAAVSPQSGAEYLQQKRAHMQSEITEIDSVRAITGTELRDSLVQGNRLLLLLPRQLAPQLAEKLKTESGLEVAGPFPPSGFAKLLS
jgi:hypothetical protein